MTTTNIIPDIYDTIIDRRENPQDNSYVRSLIQHRKGIDKILEKVGEETTELIIAAKNQTAGTGERSETIYEASDLIFHLLVLLAQCDITWEDIEKEMGSRRK